VKEARIAKQVLVRYDVLCYSLNQNEVPLLTITAPNTSTSPVEVGSFELISVKIADAVADWFSLSYCTLFQSRDMIVLTSRVHPGEPNSSYVMHGILHQLIFGSKMEKILERYIFKIVPMLNVEGVINGCSRCGLTDEDLNRRWKNPNPFLHPSIYNTKVYDIHTFLNLQNERISYF
jgi:hypothetical protein